MSCRALRGMVGAALVAGGILGTTSVALAAVPKTITHQGRLYDATDKPVDATLSVTFAIYASAAGGAPIWTETDSIAFDDGYFSVSLGEATPFGAPVFD